MKTSSWMKKTFAAGTAAALLFAFSSATFAVPSVSTTTTYIGDGKVRVSSTVSNVGNDEEVAFMVTKTAATPTTGDDIVYIDQANVGSTDTHTFSFTADAADTIANLNATVRAGTSSTAATAVEGDKTLSIGKWIVTYSDPENGTLLVKGAYSSDVAEIEEGQQNATASVWQDVTTDPEAKNHQAEELQIIMIPDYGYEIGTLTIGGEEQVLQNKAAHIHEFTPTADNTTVSVTFTQTTGATGSATVTSAVSQPDPYVDGANAANNSMTVYATASGAVQECGILITKDSGKVATITNMNADAVKAVGPEANDDDIRRFKSLGGAGTTGEYGITLINESVDNNGYIEAGAVVYAVPYAIGQDGNVSFGVQVTITMPQE